MLVFLPRIEDFVVGSVFWQVGPQCNALCGVGVCAGSLCAWRHSCSRCMFLMLPEPSHDPSIKDWCCRTEYICTQIVCANIICTWKRPYCGRLGITYSTDSAETFLAKKSKCIVFSYTPPWEIVFISNEYQCILIVIWKWCCHLWRISTWLQRPTL